MFKELIWNLIFKNDEEFILSNIDMDELLEQERANNAKLSSNLKDFQSQYNTLLQQYNSKMGEFDTLNQELAETVTKYTNLVTQNALEEYWNNKRPKTLWLYPARPNIVNPSVNTPVDPRIFFQTDYTIPRVISGKHDDIAMACLYWVRNNNTYKSEEREHWQFAYETIERKAGDCDDINILLANMLLMSGIPYWRVRINVGMVKDGGHLFVTYLRESDNEWYVLDAVYYFSECVEYKKKWKDAEKYIEIWASFNKLYMYGDLPKDDNDGGKSDVK